MAREIKSAGDLPLPASSQDQTVNDYKDRLVAYLQRS
jgi:hypothetical protein